MSSAQIAANSDSLPSEGSTARVLSSDDWVTFVDNGAHHLHFWVVTEPFNGSTLKLQPLSSTDSISGTLRFNNSRGECINECNIVARAGQQLALDLDSFMAGGETEGGLKHAHLQVITTVPCQGQIQISTSVRSILIPPLHNLSDRCPRAVPLSLSSCYNHVVALVNPFERQATVRCRLFIGTRNPEEVCLIPAKGTVVISPEVLFYTVLKELNIKGNSGNDPLNSGVSTQQGYLRFTTRHDKPLGFQLLEELTFSATEKVLGGIS